MRLQVEELEPRVVPSTASTNVPTPEAIPGLYSTGVDNQRHSLSQGVTDPHYLVLVPASGKPAPACSVLDNGFPFNGYWLPDDSFSDWISSVANVNDYNGGASSPVGPSDYRTTFDLSGLNWHTAQISGPITGDNTVTQVLLNGKSVGFTSSEAEMYRAFASLSITSGFKAGENTLDFIVQNLPQPAGQGNLHNPSGFRAELSGTALAFAPDQTKDAIQEALKQEAKDYQIAKDLKISVENVQLLDKYASVVAGVATEPTLAKVEKALGQSGDKFKDTFNKYLKLRTKQYTDEILLKAITEIKGTTLGNLANNVDKARLAVREKYPTPDLSQFNKLNLLGKVYKGSEKELDGVKVKLKLDPNDVKFLGVTSDKSVKGLEVSVFAYEVRKYNMIINVSVEAEAEGGQLKFGYSLVPKVEFKDVTGGVKVEIKR